MKEPGLRYSKQHNKSDASFATYTNSPAQNLKHNVSESIEKGETGYSHQQQEMAKPIK